MDSFTKIGSCPLKLILFGEHSVLIGGRCLAICIDKHAHLFLRNVENKLGVNETSRILKVEDSKGRRFFLDHDYKKINSPIKKYDSLIKIDYNLGCGLGTSAAISLLCALQEKLSAGNVNKNYNIINNKSVGSYLYQIYQRALVIENVFHFKSSGVDVSSVYFGGFISFYKKAVEKLDSKHLLKYKILIYDSKISKDTSAVLKSKLNDKKNIYNQLKIISDKAYKTFLRDFKLKDIYVLIKEAQDLLETLGVVPAQMKDEVRRLRKIGVESKITGAGFGGHLFTIVDKDFAIDGWLDVKIDETGFFYQ